MASNVTPLSKRGFSGKLGREGFGGGAAPKYQG
jgi:hypothetical protein